MPVRDFGAPPTGSFEAYSKLMFSNRQKEKSRAAGAEWAIHFLVGRTAVPNYEKYEKRGGPTDPPLRFAGQCPPYFFKEIGVRLWGKWVFHRREACATDHWPLTPDPCF